jgi:hypothetical protein
MKKTEFQVLKIEGLHVAHCLGSNLGILCVCELWGGSPGDLCMILSVDKFNFCRLCELAIQWEVRTCFSRAVQQTCRFRKGGGELF